MDSNLIESEKCGNQGPKSRNDLEPPWETPSAAFSFSGAQTGVAPGVTVDHACSAPSRFDSERAHDMLNERKRIYALDVLGS